MHIVTEEMKVNFLACLQLFGGGGGVDDFPNIKIDPKFSVQSNSHPKAEGPKSQHQA